MFWFRLTVEQHMPAMWEVSAITDRVLSFLVTRRHLLFFYSYPQGFPADPIQTMLQRHGNDMVD